MTDLADAIGDRRLAELCRYWDRCRRGREMPARRDLDPVDIPRLLSILILVDVKGDGDYRMRLIGTELVNFARRDITGLSFEDAFSPGPYLDYLYALYGELIRERRPIYTEGIHVIGSPGRRRYTRRLILPLSADGRRIDMVIGAHVYEMMTDPGRAALHDRKDPYIETVRRTLAPVPASA